MLRKLFFTLSFLLLLVRGFSYASNTKELNIILITIDSLRYDHLGCYGYKHDISPAIDKLAQDGVLFAQAISTASWTCPALCSLLTSMYPSTNQIYFWDQILPDNIPTVTQVLKKEGYRTAFFSGHGALSKNNGIDRGFDYFQDINDANAIYLSSQALAWV